MKVKLLVSRAGPAGAFNRGDEVEVSEAEARRMFEADPPQAVPVRDDPAIETTAKNPRKPRGKA